MKVRELILDAFIGTHLFEMAFERKRIIERLTSLQDQINEHALKIIVWPDAQEVPHWQRELITWGNRLAAIDLRSGKRWGPMGFALPWKHLYQEPFEHSARALPFRLQLIGDEYQRPITKPPEQIMDEYLDFIRPFCQAIGQGQSVASIVAQCYRSTK